MSLTTAYTFASNAITDPTAMPANARHALSTLRKANIHKGITYVPDFPEALLSHVTSGKHQVRTELFNKEHLESMVESMKGDLRLTVPEIDWPAVLLWKKGTTFQIVDGIHRGKSYRECNIATLSAVIVDLSVITDNADKQSQLAYLIAAIANTGNGLPTTMLERISNAMHMHATMGMSLAEAGRHVNVSAGTLSQYQSRTKGLERAAHLGVSDPWQQLAATVQSALGGIANDVPFKKSVQYVRDAGLTLVQTKDFIQEVKDARDVNAQVRVVDKARVDNENTILSRASGGRGNRITDGTKGAATGISRKLSVISKYVTTPNFTGLFPTRPERATAIKELTRTRNEIDAAILELQSAQKSRSRVKV